MKTYYSSLHALSQEIEKRVSYAEGEGLSIGETDFISDVTIDPEPRDIEVTPIPIEIPPEENG